jgi:hypothetical protein
MDREHGVLVDSPIGGGHNPSVPGRYTFHTAEVARLAFRSRHAASLGSALTAAVPAHRLSLEDEVVRRKTTLQSGASLRNLRRGATALPLDLDDPAETRDAADSDSRKSANGRRDGLSKRVLKLLWHDERREECRRR